jgi:hypothetical protein
MLNHGQPHWGLDEKAFNFSNTCFDHPEVYIEIRLGKYLFRCIYTTTLRLKDEPYNGRRNWWLDSTFTIKEVDIQRSDLLDFRCDCDESRKSCPVSTLIGKHSDYHRNGRASHPSYPRAFPFFPCSERQRWENKLASLGEPAVSAFSLHVNTALTRQPPQRHVSCHGCIKSIAKGSSEEKGMEMVPKHQSSRCRDGLCGKCCVLRDCNAHRRCLVCRKRRMGVNIDEPCLKIFSGHICE